MCVCLCFVDEMKQLKMKAWKKFIIIIGNEHNNKISFTSRKFYGMPYGTICIRSKLCMLRLA
jgi:hypothetical protein